MEQEKANRDLDLLERQLAAKQADMARMQTGSGQVVMLKQHYNRVLGELQQERDQLQSEHSQLQQVHFTVSNCIQRHRCLRQIIL